MARKARPEEQFGDDAFESEEQVFEAEEPPRAAPGGFTSGVLLTTGFGFVVGGVALQLAEKIAWPLVEAREVLAGQGLTPFQCALTGFVAFGFGLVHRAARRPHVRVAPSDGGDVQESVNQMWTELVGGLHRVQETVEGLGRRMNVITHEQQQFLATLQNTVSQTKEGGDSSEAVFRLAAGLDKLHAQIDQQIGVLAKQNAEELQSLGEVLRAVSEPRPVAPAPAAPAAPGLPTPHVAEPAAPAIEPPAPAPEPAAALPTPAPKPAPMPEEPPVAHDIYQAPPPAQEPEVAGEIDADRMVKEGLGALDQLEGGAQASAALEPSAETHPEFFETVGSLGEAPQEPPPALPSPQAAAPVVSPVQEPVPVAPVTPPPAAAPLPITGHAQSAPAREDALEALLPDETLREALGDR